MCNSSHRPPAFVDQGRRLMGAQVKRFSAVASVIATLGMGERQSDKSISTLGIKLPLCKNKASK